jgi:hypothetical protein
LLTSLLIGLERRLSASEGVHDGDLFAFIAWYFVDDEKSGCYSSNSRSKKILTARRSLRASARFEANLRGNEEGNEKGNEV